MIYDSEKTSPLQAKCVFRPWWLGCGNVAVVPRLRVAEVNRKRVKALAMSRAQPCPGAVKGVPDNRVPRHCELRAYLVRHAGVYRHFEKRCRPG